MKWLVTGSAGFIGSNLMERLDDADGWDVKIGKNVLMLDAEAVGDVDRIVHLAALSGIQQCDLSPRDAYLTNCTGTFRVLEAARVTGSSVIFASSAAAARPANPYAASKAAAEAWCEAYAKSYGVEVSVLRLGNVYGPGSWNKTSVIANMLRSAIEKDQIPVDGDGSQLRHFVHVGDVYEAIQAAFLGSCSVRPMEATPIIDVANFIRELTGASIVYRGQRENDARIPADRWPRVPMHHRNLWDGIEETMKWFEKRSKTEVLSASVG